MEIVGFADNEGNGGHEHRISSGDLLMATHQEHFVIDAKGKKTAVIVPIREYERLLEDLHDLAIVAERRDETPISFGEMTWRLS
jgi:hypothetical protein